MRSAVRVVPRVERRGQSTLTLVAMLASGSITASVSGTQTNLPMVDPESFYRVTGGNGSGCVVGPCLLEEEAPL